jgi:hypothetical protein
MVRSNVAALVGTYSRASPPVTAELTIQVAARETK